MNKKTMYNLTYGLFVLTAKDGGFDNGCIINTAGQVTGSPNRISITVNKANYTHDMIVKTGEFNVSIISEDADFSLFEHFGFQSGHKIDKFCDYKNAKRSANGLNYIVKGCNGFLSGKVVQTLDLGTHTMFIADVTDGDIVSDTPSVTYAYYQQHIKPAPKKHDDLEKTTDETGKTVWRCIICGYEYVGEELPEDFICPICKHPASDFERVQ